MAKKPSPFAEIAQGLTEAISIANGDADPGTYRTHVPETIDVRAVRSGLRLSQPQFAKAFGFTVGRVRDWEQRRSEPDTATRCYLYVIQRKGGVVSQLLGSPMPRRKATVKRGPDRRLGAVS